MRRRSWHLAAAVGLLALLAVVATVQYRWLGDVSRAERERLQAALRARASDFSAAIDGDLTRAFTAFEVDASQFTTDPYAAVHAAAERAARETATGSAVRAIFVVEPGTAGTIRRLDEGTRTLVSAELPPDLSEVGRRLASSPLLAIAGLPLPPGFLADAVDGDAPALVVPIMPSEMNLHPPAPGLMVRTLPERTPWHAVLVWLDRDRLGTELVAPLVSRYFGDPASSDFNVSVIARTSQQPIYRSGSIEVNPKAADMSTELFALRLGDLHWTRSVNPAGRGGAGLSKLLQDRVAITIFRREDSESGASAMKAAGPGAAWTLLAQARLGSLDAVVARSRLRNLSVSLGVLGILGAGLALILVASAREQRTARQQLEFVASVSHELRTPLAVIRSAGENLADGVVSGDQIARYGSLISSEGRRLSEMVERVMDFAGITSGTLIRTRRPTDVGEVLSASVAALQADAAERNISMHVRASADLPPVAGDVDALRSAVQNVIGNAVKYSRPGSKIDLEVAASADAVRIVVSDQGIGIDAGDLPHVFEPFFRGRRAVDAQIRGSGVGLSVVRKIIDAHGGSAQIAARDGGGTVFTIELPTG